MNIRESTKGLYVYGFVPTNSAADQFRGLGNIHVFDIPYKNATAIVSKKKVVDLMDLGKDSLAKLLIGHQQTIERLMGLGFNTIIPMRLGTFAYEPIDVLSAPIKFCEPSSTLAGPKSISFKEPVVPT